MSCGSEAHPSICTTLGTGGVAERGEPDLLAKRATYVARWARLHPNLPHISVRERTAGY